MFLSGVCLPNLGEIIPSLNINSMLEIESLSEQVIPISYLFSYYSIFCSISLSRPEGKSK